MMVLPVVGVATVFFFAQLNTGVSSYEAARAGAAVAALVGVVIYGTIAISAIFLPEERSARLLFVFGGLIGLGVLVVIDVYATDYVRAFLIERNFGASVKS